MVMGKFKGSATILLGTLGVFALSALALGLSQVQPSEHITSEGRAYTLPLSAEVSHAVLSDGRRLEVDGLHAQAVVFDGASQHRFALPTVRRLGSVTVMPGGQVLLWGGVDAQGHVIESGDWFDPDSGRVITANDLGLPARAGHSLTVLTDGDVLMTGGWSQEGPATQSVLWKPLLRHSDVLSDSSDAPRMGASAELLADGSVQVHGGVDPQGRAAHGTKRWAPPQVAPGSSAHALVAATYPAAEATEVPIHGPLALRFGSPVNLRDLNNKTVTLLGPEGSVSVRVVGVEAGRLAFVQLPNDLFPGSRYTLFVQGLHAANGESVPYTAVGFTTARSAETSTAVAGQGGLPAPRFSISASAEPPLILAAGGGAEICAASHAGELCREHGFIRDGAWYPGRDNQQDATGGHWRVYGPHQDLPDTGAQEAALPLGTTALIGQVRQIDESPVANVEVSIGDVHARTDAKGIFVLTGLSATGKQEVFVDGRSASHGDMHYGRFLVGADVKAKAVVKMPFVMYLPRVLPRDEIDLPTPTSREVVLTHPDMPGLELHVPAGAVFKDRDGHVLTHIAIVPTPVDHAPFPLPDNFPTYFTIQPGDAVVEGVTPEAAKGIRVVYPNYGGLKPQTHGDFWVYSTKEGWQMYGSGHVTADAKQLTPDPGVSLVWALGAGASMSNANGPNGRACSGAAVSQPVDLQTGMFFHEWDDLSVNDIVPASLTRAYNSADNLSHVFGVGGNSNYGIHLYSSDGTFKTPQVVMPCGEGIAFNLISGGNTVSWPFPTGTMWQHTGTMSSFYGATLQFLYDNTTDGAHWYLNMKDGSQYAFTRHIPNALSWMQDRFGNRLQMFYNGGLLDHVVSPSGRFIALSYDSKNRIVSAVDHTGRTVSYAYNTNGTLFKVTYPDQTTEQYTYDTNLRMLTMQDRRGNVWVTNQYDTNGRVIKQTLTDGAAYQFAYSTDSGNQVTATTVTDPLGNQEKLSFDSVSHYPVSDTHAYGTPLAQTTTYVRESSGLMDSITDELGRVTTFAYDEMGNTTKVTALSGTSDAVSYQFQYSPDDNQLVSVTDPLGHTTSYSYDHHCLSQTTDALGHTGQVQCNGAGLPVAMTDPLGHSVYLTYQGYDLSSITDNQGRTTRFEVDNLGRPVTTRDANGNLALTQYDSNNRVLQVTDELNRTVTYAYDGNGNVLHITMPGGAMVSAIYDASNRPTQYQDALNQSEYQTYDAAGNIQTFTDRKGQTTTYAPRDALGRFTQLIYADGSTVTADHYDAGNRLTQLTDSSYGTVQRTFDTSDRPTSETSPQGTVAYTYYVNGLRKTMTAGNQAPVNYVYDAANRLTGITQGSEQIGYTYDAANRRSTLTLPNGVVATYSYDAADQLVGINYNSTSNSALGSLTYGYNNLGQRIKQTTSFGGNLAVPTVATTGAFDSANRQTAFNGQALSYDANGNLTGDGVSTYVWNARDQLVQIKQGTAVLASFQYDVAGRRSSKTLNGVTTAILYDGPNPVQEAQGGIVNPILTGLGIDERFARNETSGRTYFLTDALGSTVGLTDAAANLVQQYKYDSYGNVATSGTATNPYQYTGRENDGAGLYYYRARYYSPAMARFIGEDPTGFGGGQSNFYSYVGANPIGFTDPYGLWAFGDPLPQGLVDFSAGWGDMVSFGLTNKIRDLAGTNDVVNRCSGSYRGGEAAGFVNDLAIGWAGGARSAVKGYAEFSHSLLPNRFLKTIDNGFARWLNVRGNRLNGDFITWELHAAIDPWAYRFAPKAWKSANAMFPAWRQLINRMPYFPGSAIFGSGAAAMNASACGCS